MTVRQEFNTLYKPIFKTIARYIHLWGGRARGGSHAGTAYFLFLLMQPNYFRGVFLRAVFGDIRGSLWQDFKDRMDAADVNLKDFAINETQMTVTYKPTGNSIISKGFKKSSKGQSAKLKSLAGMTHVLIEEGEEVAEDDFTQLDDSIRTTKVEHIKIFLLFNPPHKNHWLIKRYYNLLPSGHKGWYQAVPKNMPDLLSIHSTYLDNVDNLNKSTLVNYRDYGDPNSPKYNPDKFYRDVKGLVSEGKKGRIITRCYPIMYEEFRNLPYPSFYALDFGYASDPVALIELKFHNGRAYKHELIYKAGLTDDDLVKEMKQVGVNPKAQIYADSAEPKSIATIRKYGFNVIGAKKGPDSLLNGIKYLQSLDFFITESSVNAWREVEEYSWALDSDKNLTDTPIDAWNHTIDADRYGLTMHAQHKSGVVMANSGRSDDPYDMLDEL